MCYSTKTNNFSPIKQGLMVFKTPAPWNMKTPREGLAPRQLPPQPRLRRLQPYAQKLLRLCLLLQDRAPLLFTTRHCR